MRTAIAIGIVLAAVIVNMRAAAAGCAAASRFVAILHACTSRSMRAAITVIIGLTCTIVNMVIAGARRCLACPRRAFYCRTIGNIGCRTRSTM